MKVQENKLGSLAPGKLAERVLLEADPRNDAPDKISELKVFKHGLMERESM
jgi:predicted amidohydrolase YtcJ